MTISNIRRTGVNQLCFYYLNGRFERTYSVTNPSAEIKNNDERSIRETIERADFIQQLRDDLKLYGCSLEVVHPFRGLMPKAV